VYVAGVLISVRATPIGARTEGDTARLHTVCAVGGTEIIIVWSGNGVHKLYR